MVGLWGKIDLENNMPNIFDPHTLGYLVMAFVYFTLAFIK